MGCRLFIGMSEIVSYKKTFEEKIVIGKITNIQGENCAWYTIEVKKNLILHTEYTKNLNFCGFTVELLLGYKMQKHYSRES